MSDSPFSGGGGVPVDPNAPAAPMPKPITDLMGILNKATAKKYVIDLNGAILSLEFKANGFVTLESSGTSMEVPYTRG